MKEWKGPKRVHCLDSMAHSFNNEEYKGEVVFFISYQDLIPMNSGYDQALFIWVLICSEQLQVMYLWLIKKSSAIWVTQNMFLFLVSFKWCWIMVKSRNGFCWTVKQEFFWKLLVMLTHLIQGRKGKRLELIWGISISLCKFLKMQWNYKVI